MVFLLAGSLQIYKDKTNVWSSSFQANDIHQAVLQDDGNFVIYDTKNKIVWETASKGKGTGPFSLTLSDNGTLFLKDSTNSPIWSNIKTKSDTLFSNPIGLQENKLRRGDSLFSKNGDFKLILNGDLSIYKGEKWIWTSGFHNNSILRTVLQSDGDFVVYDYDEKIVWTSETSGKGIGPYRLILEDDGNLTLRDSNQKILWISRRPETNTIKSDANYLEYNKLKAREAIYSKKNNYSLRMEENGNLVLYQFNFRKWTSNTNGKNGSYVILQNDGNFVLYNSSKSPIWASGTNGRGNGPFRVVLGDDGSIILYCVKNYPLWTAFKIKDTLLSYTMGENNVSTLNKNESIKSLDDKFELKMQNDGNLVLYSGNNAIWATATQGKGGSFAVIQEDGNFVVYRDNNNPIWSSNTMKKGNAPYRLVVQNDGNMVLYDVDGSSIWATNTKRK